MTTIFVDHFSKFAYAHFSEIITASKAAEAKYAFEKYAAAFGVNIEK